MLVSSLEKRARAASKSAAEVLNFEGGLEDIFLGCVWGEGRVGTCRGVGGRVCVSVCGVELGERLGESKRDLFLGAFLPEKTWILRSLYSCYSCAMRIENSFWGIL